MADGRHTSGPYFNQQGQHVYGPQYNADDIHISQADPRSIADGMAWDRRIRKAEQDAIRRRHEQARAAADKAKLRLALIIISISLFVWFVGSSVLRMLT